MTDLDSIVRTWLIIAYGPLSLILGLFAGWHFCKAAVHRRHADMYRALRDYTDRAPRWEFEDPTRSAIERRMDIVRQHLSQIT